MEFCGVMGVAELHDWSGRSSAGHRCGGEGAKDGGCTRWTRAYITAAPSDPRARCMEPPPPPHHHRTRDGRPASCAPPPARRGVGCVVPNSTDRAPPQNSSSSGSGSIRAYGEPAVYSDRSEESRRHCRRSSCRCPSLSRHKRRWFVRSFSLYNYYTTPIKLFLIRESSKCTGEKNLLTRFDRLS